MICALGRGYLVYSSDRDVPFIRASFRLFSLERVLIEGNFSRVGCQHMSKVKFC